jgi:hypothetical protein
MKLATDVTSFVIGDEMLSEGLMCIPSDVDVICDNFCSGVNSILGVTFEASCRVVRIGNRAFHSCGSLSSICIPSSVERLSVECFADCVRLSTVTFDSGSRLICIGNYVFSGC